MAQFSVRMINCEMQGSAPFTATVIRLDSPQWDNEPEMVEQMAPLREKFRPTAHWNSYQLVEGHFRIFRAWPEGAVADTMHPDTALQLGHYLEGLGHEVSCEYDNGWRR